MLLPQQTAHHGHLELGPPMKINNSRARKRRSTPQPMLEHTPASRTTSLFVVCTFAAASLTGCSLGAPEASASADNSRQRLARPQVPLNATITSVTEVESHFRYAMIAAYSAPEQALRRLAANPAGTDLNTAFARVNKPHLERFAQGSDAVQSADITSRIVITNSSSKVVVKFTVNTERRPVTDATGRVNTPVSTDAYVVTLSKEGQQLTPVSLDLRAT